MKFIELSYGDGTLSTVVFVLAGVAFVSALVMLFLASSKVIEFSAPIFALFIVLMVAAISLATWATLRAPSSFEARNEQLKEVKSQIEDRYDIRLAKDELQDLSYPLNEPEKDFEVFGTVTRNVELKEGFERQEISLLWRNDRFELAQSNDGQGFTALKPRNGSDEGSVSDEPFFAPSSEATEKPSDD